MDVVVGRGGGGSQSNEKQHDCKNEELPNNALVRLCPNQRCNYPNKGTSIHYVTGFSSLLVTAYRNRPVQYSCTLCSVDVSVRGDVRRSNSEHRVRLGNRCSLLKGYSVSGKIWVLY